MVYATRFGSASAILALTIALSAPAFARQGADIPAARPAAIPTYPATAKGLEKFMKDMMKLALDGDKQLLANYAKSLVLPDPENWFASVFGDALGPQLAKVSERSRNEIELSAPDMLAQVETQKRTSVEAVRLDDSCSTLALAVESPFLQLRQRPEPLYDVRFSGHGDTSVWLYFAYVDGAFRYIGSMRRKGLEAAGSRSGGANRATPAALVRVAGAVQMASLIEQDKPVYPDDAKRAGRAGDRCGEEVALQAYAIEWRARRSRHDDHRSFQTGSLIESSKECRKNDAQYQKMDSFAPASDCRLYTIQ